MDLESKGKGGVFCFCWCNNKKPAPVPETGMLQVWSRERMNWAGQVGFELPVSQPRADAERVVTGPGPPLQYHCSVFLLSQTGLSGQSISKVHLGQALEFFLEMERGQALSCLQGPHSLREGSIISIHCDGGSGEAVGAGEGLWFCLEPRLAIYGHLRPCRTIHHSQRVLVYMPLLR